MTEDWTPRIEDCVTCERQIAFEVLLSTGVLTADDVQDPDFMEFVEGLN